jgi:ABC-2 type transport system ATP-binding protein
VRQLLRFYGSLKNGSDINAEVDRWLERFELSEWAGKKVDTLSKGMSQKVQFIAAVVSRPRLLILDEPFTGLDPVNADVIRQAVLDIRRQGTTIILSTHDMGVAERMCDFIFMIFRGRKVLDGTLQEIQAAYGNDTLRIRTEDGSADLGEIEGVDRVSDFGFTQELRVSAGIDPQEVLASVLARTRLQSFEMAKPSLHDIFVRIAGPEAREAGSEDGAILDRASVGAGGEVGHA